MPIKTGYTFKDKSLLRRALTHTSAVRTSLDSNERLEFLGDRVMNMLVAELLCEAFPKEREGDLAKRHTNLVCAPTLALIADDIALPGELNLSTSEASSGGAQKTNIVSDALEALVAAIYLDGGLGAARDFVRAHWMSHLESSPKPPQDSKSKLQEWAQGRGLPLPLYDIVERSGPDHAPVFTVTVAVEGHGDASGQGASKRDAEKAAAEKMLEQIA